MTDFAFASVKAVGTEDSGPGQFEAVLSTSTLDRDGEVIAAKAFDPLPASIPIYFEHDWKSGATPIGRGEPFYDPSGVVKVKGTFASTARAQEIRSLVVEGVVDSMSVGFLNGKRQTKSGVPTVVSGEVFEGSLTAIPINTTARVLASKALNGEPGHTTKAIEGSHEALRERLCDALEVYGEYCCWIRGVMPTTVVFDCDGDTWQQTYTDDGTVATLTGTRVEVDIHEVVVADVEPPTDPADPTMLSLQNSEGAADAAAKAAASAVTDEAEQAKAKFRLLTQLGTV
jgi:HK97 family phage prohead protease